MTAKKDKNVKMSESMKAKAQSLMAESAMASTRLQMYIGGCKDGLGLEGDWNIDTQTWEFSPVPKKEK